MVYETDFYTTRRPYRATPSLSTYTVTSEPSRQVRILPGLGKVHVVHSYDRIIPYIGHKRLTVVTQPPVVMRVRPSTLYREFDRIENKLRPYTYHSYTNDYLNSESHVRIVYVRNPISGSYPIYRPSTLYTSRYYDPYYISRVYYPSYLDYSPTTPSSFYSYYSPLRRSYSSYSYYPSDRWYDLALYPSWRYNHFARTFDDETRLIRAQTASLLNQIHNPVPRKVRQMPLPYVTRYDAIETPARFYNDNYINRMLVKTSFNAPEYTSYWSDPVKKSFCQGRMACVTFVGGRAHPRRRNFYMYHDDPVRNDIQLLSYYINRFREEKKAMGKPIKVVLPPLRPSRVFSVPRPLEDAKESEEMIQLKEERAARLAKIIEIKPDDAPKVDVKAKAADDKAKKEAAAAAAVAAEKMKKEEDAAAEAKKVAAAKKEAEARKRAEEEAKAKEEADRKEKEAMEAAEKAAELERLAEQARQAELAKQAEIEKAKKEEEERARAEEEKRQAEAAKAEEERQQLLRLEEIARQAEEEKEAELARQAEELAELARQEAELAEQAKAEEEAAEEQRKEAEAADLAQKEAELAELESTEKELTEMAEQARIAADEAAHEADHDPEADEMGEVEAQKDEPIVEEPESPAADQSEPPAPADDDDVPVEDESQAEAETEE